MKKIIEKATISKIANLAKIKLTDKELDMFTEQFASLLDYVDMLNDVVLSDIEETSNVYDFRGPIFREDEMSIGLHEEEIFANLSNFKRKGNFFSFRSTNEKQDEDQ